jgi:hypothetical protein
VVGKVALWQVFWEYFSFPYQFWFHQILHTHQYLRPGAGTVGQLVGLSNSYTGITTSFQGTLQWQVEVYCILWWERETCLR